MKIELPQVGESVTEGIIAKWLKQVGDRVEKYDLLVEVVTDKVNMEMPSPVSGILTDILAAEGETVLMGAVIADIQVEGEDGKEAAERAGQDRTGDGQPGPIDRTGVLLTDVAPVGPTGSDGPLLDAQEDTLTASRRKRYSPAVQRLAEEHGVELSEVAGTGLGGRVTRIDVEKFAASAQSAGAVDEPEAATSPQSAETIANTRPNEQRVPLTPVRRIIADNMVKSFTQIPQAWSIVEVDATSFVDLRNSVKEDFQRREGIGITYLPFVVKAVAESLKENPLLNSSWAHDAIVIKRDINIGIAVAGPDGLVVPVVHDAGTLSIAELAKAIGDVTARAREGKLVLRDVQSRTFTVNNTGALGSIVSRPLVNYPQAAIMTTEAIVKRPIVINDAIAIRSMMNICLTFDHRVMDGAEAGEFLNSVKRRLEAMGHDTAIY